MACREASLRDQRVFLGMKYPFEIQVHIQFWPIEMFTMIQFHGEQLRPCCRSEPGELVKGEKILLARRSKPKGVRRNV
jgi:hypothetical protein